MNYATDVTQNTVTNPIRGKVMKKSRGGGYAFQIDCWDRLLRFLILGHEGGIYYATQSELSFETVDCIDECLAKDVQRTIDTIVDVNVNNRAPKVDPAIFALAYVIVQTKNNEASRVAALDAIPKICRIGTFLFQLVDNLSALNNGRPLGNRSIRRAVGNWYDRDPQKLARQVTKYAQRNGWSHRDILRLTHFKSDDVAVNNVLRYVTQHDKWLETADAGPSDEFLAAVDEAKDEKTTTARVVDLIGDYGLVREHLNTGQLNNVSVWDALLDNMPLNAMIRNLGKMSSIGLTKPLSNGSKRVVAALGDTDALKSQRVHPVAMLIAYLVYYRGRGLQGSLSWSPDHTILNALDGAFYAAFDAVEPTGKNFLLGVDVSGSMASQIFAGTDKRTGRSLPGVLSCAQAAAVMAMLVARTEPNAYILGFSSYFVDLGITALDTFESACNKVQLWNFGSTNIGVAIEHAIYNELDVDAFCIFSDMELNHGGHPTEHLRKYRQRFNPDAKMAAFGLAQTDISVVDPSDPGQAGFVGFDTSVPQLLANFVTTD
jgi:60 kDa SS-A/Ro ribonucleoprotein